MFQDRTIQQAERSKVMIPVILTLVNGETLKGSIAVPRNGRLGDVLNGGDRFVLFENNAGEPIYLSHNSIAAVRSNDLPKVKQLDSALKHIDSTNPYTVLKVSKGIDKTTLRDAYHDLVKNYHPDQFANAPLPNEVRTYLDTVIQRLNSAYQEIEEDIERAERFRQAKAAATTAPRESALGSIRYFGQ